MKHFKILADSGRTFNDGVVLAENDKKMTNILEETSYYKLLADVGDSGKTYKSGFVHEKGLKGGKDLSEWIKYCKLSTDVGDIVGRCNYAFVHAKVFKGRKDIRKQLFLSKYQQMKISNGVFYSRKELEERLNRRKNFSGQRNISNGSRWKKFKLNVL
jgi:hypothetical protein